MDIAQREKKQEKDKKYWEDKLAFKKKYQEEEEVWKKDLLKLNPEVPKPYTR